MKVVLSIPDPLCSQADALARRLKLSRSNLYTQALEAFLAVHEADHLVEIANTLADQHGTERDPLLHAAARTVPRKPTGELSIRVTRRDIS